MGLKSVSKRRNDALSRVPWERLETLLAEHYRREGYQVEHVGTGGTKRRFDGGIDLKLRKDDAYILVQCKHWNAYKVTHNAVHELLGLMVNEGATGAILVSSGEFTRAAIEAAARLGHVQLIDGDELRAMLGPLPEPASPPSRFATIAARAGARLLLAAEDRIRHGGRRSRRAAEVGIDLLLLKGAFVLAAMLFVVMAINSALRSVTTPVQRPAQATLAIKSAAAPVVAVSATTARTDSSHAACEELIDKASGTYIDHCAQVSRPRPPTAAEIRESQRNANEAIRVLAPNTPEM